MSPCSLVLQWLIDQDSHKMEASSLTVWVKQSGCCFSASWSESLRSSASHREPWYRPSALLPFSRPHCRTLGSASEDPPGSCCTFCPSIRMSRVLSRLCAIQCKSVGSHLVSVREQRYRWCSSVRVYWKRRKSFWALSMAEYCWP